MSDSTRIRQFILLNLNTHNKDIAAVTATRFQISRQAVLKHINKMIADKMIEAEGEKSKRVYRLKFFTKILNYNLPGIDESEIYLRDILPHIRSFPKHILDIAQYGLTEMINNANDHSGGTRLKVVMAVSQTELIFFIHDNGVGIFRKIADAMQLSDIRYSILELAKGKFTTDRTKHSGEGIFFTSKLCSKFNILSGNLRFSHDETRLDMPDIMSEIQTGIGTTVVMQINHATTANITDVFMQFSDEDYGFSKTAVEVRLLRLGDEELLSRSQAKRLLARFEKFKTVLLDFKDINLIGQAFADEIFRVFAAEYPHIRIETANTTKDVEMMIKRAKLKNSD